MITLAAQYFLNHRLDRSEIEWQVEALARAGYQAVYAHARAGLLTPYLSESWWQAVDTILEVCRRTGMQLWIWDEDYFPSGFAGGRVVWDDPGLSARRLELVTKAVEGGGPFEVDFAPGSLLRAFAVEVLPGGAYGPAQDITRWCGTRRQEWRDRRIRHGAYSPGVNPVGHPHWRCNMIDNWQAACWTPPRAGAYIIIGAMAQTSEGSHPDILRPEGIRRFIEVTHEAYRQRYPADIGGVIGGCFTDEPSPHGGLFPWTARFPEHFRQDHGYDLTDQLFHLAIDADERSATVRHHYRLTQHRLLSEHYVGQIARWCSEHRIQMSGHLTRTEWLTLVAGWWPNELRCYRAMDLPATDPLGGSCGWPASASYHTGLKVVSSAAHLFGRRQAGSDALAVIGEEASLRDLKFMLDYQMVMGINHFNVHGLLYSVDGPRKDEVPPSLFYQHTEWAYMRTLLDAVRTTAEALTDGVHCCELALVYPSTSLGCQLRAYGVNPYAPLPDETAIHALVEQLLSHQKDFDFIDEVTLGESVDARGRLAAPEAYRVILLPHLRYIDAGAAEALRRFAGAGGRVIAVGTMPRAIPGTLDVPGADWADGKVEFWGTLDESRLSSLPGLEVQGPGARDIFTLRRRKDNEECLFIVNRSETPFAGQVQGRPVRLPGHGSRLLTGREAVGDGNTFTSRPPVPADDIDLSGGGWVIRFEPNQAPLNFWHVVPPDRALDPEVLSETPAFDLMRREPEPALPSAAPAAAGERVRRYACRFMLTGAIPDARLVIEDSTLTGDWQVLVNGAPIEGWKRAVIFDCRNLEAPVAQALRGGSNPTLNVVSVVCRGQEGGLHEVPYLYGSFTCEYRYGHLSFPFLRGRSGPLDLTGLLPWGELGYPGFSGTAVYERTVSVPKRGRYVLDLGRVEDLAAVAVDGESRAVLAWPPYVCDLGLLEPRAHRLEITVANAPANRNRAARLPAGLLGPVVLRRMD